MVTYDISKLDFGMRRGRATLAVSDSSIGGTNDKEEAIN